MTNPFLTQISDEDAAWAERRAKGRKILADAGIEVGSYARVSWKVDDRYGGMILSHEGVVDELTDTWIHIKNSPRSPGHLGMGLAAITSATVEVEKLSANDVTFPACTSGESTVIATSADNPFLAPTAKISGNPFLNGD